MSYFYHPLYLESYLSTKIILVVIIIIVTIIILKQPNQWLFPFKTLLFRALKCNYPCNKSFANKKKNINMASILIGCIQKHDLIPGQISSSVLRAGLLNSVIYIMMWLFAPGCTFSILPLFSPVNGSSSLTD